MTESFVTQCPKCSTRFRVSLEQLATAQGAVRCGACLQVFNAASQLREQGHSIPDVRAPQPALADAALTAESPPSAGEEEESRSEEQAQRAHEQPNLDELNLDDLDLDEELAKLEEQEQQLSRQLLEPAVQQRAEPDFDEHADDVDDREPQLDENWAQTLLGEPLTASEPQPAASETLHEPAGVDFGKQPADLNTLTESLPPIPATPGLRDLPNKPKARQDNLRSTPTFSLNALRDDEEPSFNSDVEEPVETGKRQRNEPNLRDEALFELEDEPLQLEWQAKRTPWGRWFVWSLLNLLAIGALGAQYVTYHFAELARQDQYRPWFAEACPVIGCKLPSKVDIAQLKSSNLVVRSHPEFRGALVVDAIIYNRAPFSQPFPLLEMRFADLSGQLIASRRFKPSEYLAGELAGQAEMPPQTPIHIALDILDPGPRAVNYSLNFHSPE